MDENDTPETDAAECDASELYGDDSSGPSGYVPIEAAQKLELERDRYKEKLAEFMAIADEFAESRRGVTRFLVLADEIEEGFPELAIGRFNGDDDSE